MIGDIMNEKPSVAVLMSTYNGERFLEEQINSVLAQEGVEVTLYIRDDGSTDNTKNIICAYRDRVNMICGENMGVGNSFMQILYEAGHSYDYYAFCDQDDIWLNTKLCNAIDKIDMYDTPTLYCSNQTLVNSSGDVIGLRHAQKVDTSYMQILCNNRISGCTMVWNQPMQLALSAPERRPSKELLKKRIHDVWVVMVATIIGTVVYDEESFILYRQHENNVVGVKESSLITEWKKKLKNPDLRNGRSVLAREIVEKYKDLAVDQDVISRLSHYAYYQSRKEDKRFTLADKEIKKYSGESDWQLRMKILLKLF
jgi:glycosyltransferase involved in cell wall biosynthesis